MYIPAHFKEDRVDVLHDAIRRAGPATLISMTHRGLFASHAPLFVDPDPAPFGTLTGHLAKANPHGRMLDSAVETLVIFTGPSGYMTPSYYQAKKVDGKVVPTWNYTAIHAYGTLETFDDPERLLPVVTRLTDMHEAGRAEPWAVTGARHVAGHLRDFAAHHPAGGQGENEPEPPRGGSPGDSGRPAGRWAAGSCRGRG
jgi:transcriptional regulator